jgi:hypothetical protein
VNSARLASNCRRDVLEGRFNRRDIVSTNDVVEVFIIKL